ncbi:MAG: hypothetical protein ACOC7J_06960 [Armatimonadota bacterium]
MVMHVRIPPRPKQEPDPPEHWPPDDPVYNPIYDRRVSLPIKIWALLHREDYSCEDLKAMYGMSKKSVSRAVGKLRKRGCRIKPNARPYHLRNPEAPPAVMNIPSGVMLGPDNPRFADHVFEITCAPDGRDWGLRIHGAPAAINAQREPVAQSAPSGEIPRVKWRPDDSVGGLFPSLTVMVWGMLKDERWGRKALARELDVRPMRITQAVESLRSRGHQVHVDVRGCYYIPAPDPPLLVEELPGFRWRVANRRGRYAGRLLILE